MEQFYLKHHNHLLFLVWSYNPYRDGVMEQFSLEHPHKLLFLVWDY